MANEPRLTMITDVIAWLEETLHSVGDMPIALTYDNAHMYPITSEYLIGITSIEDPKHTEHLCIVSALSMPEDEEEMINNLCFMQPVIRNKDMEEMEEVESDE